MSNYHKRKKSGGKVFDFWTHPDGVRLREQRNRADNTSFPAGSGTAKMTSEDLYAMRDLCDDILNKLPNNGLVPWGDGWTDKKSRAYAMLPNQSNFKNVQDVVDRGIVMHDVDAALSPNEDIRKDAVEKHNHTVNKSFITIDPPSNQLTAIEHMIQQVNTILHNPEHLPHLQPYERNAVKISNLVAIQPNFHNGDDYLPLHLDNPRHDGFGVVIVTVAVWGSAEIVLVDDGDAETSVNNTDNTNKTEITANTDTTQNTRNIDNTNNSSTTTPNSTTISTEDVLSEVSAVSTVDRSICTKQKVTVPLPVVPVVVEGGVVFRDGVFVVTTSTSAENSTTPTTHTTTDTTTHTQIASANRGYGDGDSNNGNTNHHTNTNNTDTTTDSTNTNNTYNNTSNNNNTKTTNTTTHNSSNTSTTSRSWAFPLSPGELYVLSGPARNKCAHGVVVMRPEVTEDPNKRVRGRYNTTTTHTDSTHTNGGSTSINSSGGSVDSGGAIDNILPNLAHLAHLTTPTSTTTPSTATGSESNANAIQQDSTTTNSNNTITTINPNISNTTTTNTTRTSTQPARYKGRVSLNFRFGLHTPDQDWTDIDRHWG